MKETETNRFIKKNFRPDSFRPALVTPSAGALPAIRNCRRALLAVLFPLLAAAAWAVPSDTLRGRVVDAITGEALVAATVQLPGTGAHALTDDDGYFAFTDLPRRSHIVVVSYLGYKRQSVSLVPGRPDTLHVIRMEEDETSLGTATVTAAVRRNTESSSVAQQRISLVVQNGISEQQISRTQDANTSEVIRRVPGISIIDEKFVMVRGLSQRYNNVWLNGAAVPSSEADSRAFSFDMIPSSQVSNMQIVKSPAPQYPADFTGGFILIDTKDVPDKNSARISIGASANDQTHMRTFFGGKRGGADWLGFDSFRRLRNGIGTVMRPTPGGSGVSLTGNGLDNDWTLRRHRPVADLSLSADVNRSRTAANGAVTALLAAVNYTNSYRTYSPMRNALFGAYDVTHDRSVYLRNSSDRQYAHHVRLGAMLNLTFVPAAGSARYEWKNIFNQFATDRHTSREGYNAQNNAIREAEYFYSARTTYNTQFTGKYVWDGSRLDWNAGYAYANRNQPDRRRYTLDNQLDPDRIGLTTGNEISREFTQLGEHIASGAANYRIDFGSIRFKPRVLAGVHAEYRTRSYRTRNFIYQWDAARNNLPADFRYLDLPTQLLQEVNYGDKGLYLIDDTKLRNDYDGHHLVAAAYVAANVDFGPVNVYAGVRFEHSAMRLTSNTRDYERSPMDRRYDADNLFPSLNATWKLRPDHQLRASYGRSVNRPEFREVSPSVYFDFDLASSVQGNTALRPCYVDNADLRYEWYPSQGEQITLAAFCKRFDSPIEWTYTVAGGTDLVYSYENARSAISYGLELDIRKSLDFIGLPCFTFVFNGSLIKSRVRFDAATSRQKNRPMQGQSPYLVNVGLFFNRNVWSASLQYNRIGRRLIGVGRSLGSTADQTVTIPDSYEMPRNLLDLSVTRTFGRFELKAGIKDLMGERVRFKQFSTVELPEGHTRKVEEVTRSYRPGRNFSIALSVKL